jgi:peptidyl-prolyl cis-trans isomerase B (cyclophilin B)
MYLFTFMERVISLLALLLFVTGCTETKSTRTAVIETSMGSIKAELYESKAPVTVSNFISLAKSGFYDGLTFHRVIKGFVIQGGDPNGDGTGGSDKTIPLEVNKDLTHVDGALGMARSADPNSASSQFYICDGPQHGLDGNYAVFGKVIEGMDVVRKIASVQTDAYDRPVKPVVIKSVRVLD